MAVTSLSLFEVMGCATGSSGTGQHLQRWGRAEMHSGAQGEGVGEPGKAMRNTPRMVNGIWKSRWELRRGEGSSLCNLGDRDEEPEAEGARC